MKIIDAASGVELAAGTKVDYGERGWMKVVSIDVEGKQARLHVACREMPEDVQATRLRNVGRFTLYDVSVPLEIGDAKGELVATIGA